MTTLTVDEAAALVGVSRRLVYRWITDGHLSPVRITTADRMRLVEDEVVECAAARRSGRGNLRLEAMTRRWQSECASVH